MTRTQITTVRQEEPQQSGVQTRPKALCLPARAAAPCTVARRPLRLPQPACWASRPKTPERGSLLSLTLLRGSVSPRPTLGGAASLTRPRKRHTHACTPLRSDSKALTYYGSVRLAAVRTPISTTSCCQMSENHPHGKPVLILKCGG